jgi:hypothetical protein
MPGARRNRTGGHPSIRQPSGPIATARQCSGKIKIEPAGMLGDAGIDRALGTIKLRAGFEQIER